MLTVLDELVDCDGAGGRYERTQLVVYASELRVDAREVGSLRSLLLPTIGHDVAPRTVPRHVRPQPFVSYFRYNLRSCDWWQEI
jgi:hypothetical protein